VRLAISWFKAILVGRAAPHGAHQLGLLAEMLQQAELLLKDVGIAACHHQ
jgi:hypothetical protein